LIQPDTPGSWTDDPIRAAEAGLPDPFRTLTFDVTLLRS
jgi:hypothetical protein